MDLSYSQWGVLWLVAFFVVLFLVFVLSRFRQKAEWEKARAIRDAEEKQFRALAISQVDSIRGADFERYLQRVLIAQGFDVQLTKASGDLGVDLIIIPRPRTASRCS